MEEAQRPLLRRRCAGSTRAAGRTSRSAPESSSSRVDRRTAAHTRKAQQQTPRRPPTPPPLALTSPPLPRRNSPTHSSTPDGRRCQSRRHTSARRRRPTRRRTGRRRCEWGNGASQLGAAETSRRARSISAEDMVRVGIANSVRTSASGAKGSVGCRARTTALPRGRRKMRKERESDPAGRFRRTALSRRSLCQAVLAIQWLWSFSRLWVAATNRHSDRAADLPLRMK
jgi:hypothetical protein